MCGMIHTLIYSRSANSSESRGGLLQSRHLLSQPYFFLCIFEFPKTGHFLSNNVLICFSHSEAPNACSGSPPGPTTQGPTTQGPTTQGPTTQPPTNDCAIPIWYQDGWCDDENNIAACNWDGGDCCGPQCQNGECICRDPDFEGMTMGL